MDTSWQQQQQQDVELALMQQQQIIVTLTGQLSQSQDKIERLQAENQLLKEQVEFLSRLLEEQQQTSRNPQNANQQVLQQQHGHHRHHQQQPALAGSLVTEIAGGDGVSAVASSSINRMLESLTIDVAKPRQELKNTNKVDDQQQLKETQVAQNKLSKLQAHGVGGLVEATEKEDSLPSQRTSIGTKAT